MLDTHVFKNKYIPKPTPASSIYLLLDYPCLCSFPSVNVDNQESTSEVFTFWLLCLWSRMKSNSVCTVMVRCHTVSAWSLSFKLCRHISVVRCCRKPHVHTEMQPSLINPAWVWFYALFLSFLGHRYSVSTWFCSGLRLHTIYLFGLFSPCKQIF